MSTRGVPDGWIESSLVDVVAGDAPIGYGIVQPGPHVVDGVPMIAVRDLLDVVPERLHRASQSIEAAYARSRIRPGDVLISVKGTTGRIGIVPPSVAGNISRDVARIRLASEHVPEFWLQLLRSEAAQRTLQQAGVGTTRQELSIGTLRYLAFVHPASQVQQAIADVLTDADSLIQALARLADKKRDVKQGMTQELLTGRVRLAGYSDAWTAKTVSTLGKFLRGRGVKREDVRTSGVPCIRYGELYTTYRNYTASTESFVDASVATTALPIRPGDILFAGSGETKEEIGTTVAYVGDSSAVAGGDIIVLRGTGYDPVFLASLLNTPAFAIQKARSGQGDAVVHINWRALAGIEVTVPSLLEQEAIAEVLLDTDAEIAALERRLETARAVKTGMMQQLLAGRTRLPLDASA
jgi:type I restriction enzyme, S subunit